MKVEIQKVDNPKALVCARTGAKEGDKILFSSHNDENKVLFREYKDKVKPNKVYTVLNSFGVLGFMSEKENFIHAGFKDHIGSFDIIERAPIQEQKQIFEPVNIKIENQSELVFFGELFSVIPERFMNDGNNSLKRMSNEIDKILKEKHIPRKFNVYSVSEAKK